MAMTLPEIIEELENFLTFYKEKLDEEASEWGMAKAKFLQNEDLKKAKLHFCKMKYKGADTFRTMMAYNDPDYRKFIDETKLIEDTDFFTIDFKKSSREKMVEVLRSLLSFNKTRAHQDA